jgi:hypothetical protein
MFVISSNAKVVLMSSNNSPFQGLITELVVGMAGAFVLTDGLSWIAGANEWADFVIRWGMATIVGYGVLKILLGNIMWPLLFAKKFEWKVGLLERFYNILRPVRAQKIIDESDDEEHEQQTTVEYIDRIEKTRQLFSGSEQHGGVQRMNFKNILNGIVANKWTILGIAGVAGAAVLGQPLGENTVEAVLDGRMEVILALGGQLAAGFLAVKAAVGPGLETIEQAKAREAKAKELAKAKAINAEKLIIEGKALKLAKQLGIDLEQAKIVVKAKQDKEKADKVALVAAKEKAIIGKLAKALNVTEEQAKGIRTAQLAKKAKK